jgi:hypothetical protein
MARERRIERKMEMARKKKMVREKEMMRERKIEMNGDKRKTLKEDREKEIKE